ncbi:MAG TPA: anthrone oxygenase family protein [Rhizomicrobium sp.]|nr:anthrone oxygenase family protein [Rhizomicrobium sp.]
MTVQILGLINLFFAGLLAGEELMISFGVRGPLARLADRQHIELRQALILRLRVAVPMLFGLTFLTGAVVTWFGGYGHASDLRCAALIALAAFISVTLGGTVPINEAALGWDSAAPPADWRVQVNKWERLDTIRTAAALLAFALFLGATLQR